MGELLSEIGDLVFSLVIGYIGAIELLYVVRHLYHWSFNHDAAEINDSDRLAHLQDNMRHQLDNAARNENETGTKFMQDGVQYKDGFRIDPLQDEINKLKEQLKDKSLNDMKRQELETELAKLQKVAEQTRKELAEAEATKQREEEENSRKLIEAEQKREREQRKLEEEQARKEAEENARKLEEAEKQRQQEQRRKDEEEQARQEAEENARQLMEAEKQREAEQRRKEEEQLQREAEENARKLAEKEKERELEQRRKEEEEQARQEAEENARQLMEAEKQRELEQLRKEEEEQAQREAEENARQLEELEKQRKEAEEQAQREVEENNQKLQEAERQRENEQRRKEEEEEEEQLAQQEAEENFRKLEEAEKQREEEQRRKEEEENPNEDQLAAEENERLMLEAERQELDEEAERKYLEIEHKLEEQLRAAELEADLTEKERQLIESIKRRDIREEDHNEQKEAELLRRILEAREQYGEDSEEEQSLRLMQREQDQEAKQRRIEENAMLFLEAEKEMAELQQQMQEAVENRAYASNLESAPQTPIYEEPCVKKLIVPLLDEEPSQPVNQRVKTQLAQDLNESYTVSTKPLLFPGVSDDGSSLEPTSSYQSSFSTQLSEDVTTGTDSQYPPQQERQEPEGEDTTPSLQYSEDYLHSLDGIKPRPLIRDGSGRRRAFKKRRSSNSSNSSRESRTSRDEELKMFTSLEEEEMKSTGDSEFTPIRYTSEPSLKVKGHHRRHKRSPAKDMKSDDSLRASLERLGEEPSDPWGEGQPDHYKNTDFWKREKALSIDEELELEKPVSSEDIAYDTAKNMPSASSFEEATQIQNEQALTTLQRQASKEPRNEELDAKATLLDESARSDNKTNTCS